MDYKEAGLDKILNFNQLRKLFENYSITSGLDVALYDTDGREQLAVRNKKGICECAKDYFSCAQSVAESGRKASELGSAYIYETPCGLIMCVTPFVFEEQTIGYITTGPVVLWEKDEFFIEDDAWHAAYNRYSRFISDAQDEKAAFIEAGVGYNTPSVIKYPFERFTYLNPNARLIRINIGEPQTPPEISERTVLFTEDAKEVIKDIGAAL